MESTRLTNQRKVKKTKSDNNDSIRTKKTVKLKNKVASIANDHNAKIQKELYM